MPIELSTRPDNPRSLGSTAWPSPRGTRRTCRRGRPCRRRSRPCRRHAGRAAPLRPWAARRCLKPANTLFRRPRRRWCPRCTCHGCHLGVAVQRDWQGRTPTGRQVTPVDAAQLAGRGVVLISRAVVHPFDDLANVVDAAIAAELPGDRVANIDADRLCIREDARPGRLANAAAGRAAVGSRSKGRHASVAVSLLASGFSAAPPVPASDVGLAPPVPASHVGAEPPVPPPSPKSGRRPPPSIRRCPRGWTRSYLRRPRSAARPLR